MCVYWVGGAGSRVTVSGCTGKGRDQRQRPLLQSGLQDLQPMRQVTLELQLVYLQNERLDFCVESPSSNTTLAIYQNNKTLRKILHFLLCSFPSSVRWWWEQNISTAVLLQRHSVDNHTWHMVGTLNRREKEKVWLSKVPPSKKKKKIHSLSISEMTIQQKIYGTQQGLVWDTTWKFLCDLFFKIIDLST